MEVDHVEHPLKMVAGYGWVSQRESGIEHQDGINENTVTLYKSLSN